MVKQQHAPTLEPRKEVMLNPGTHVLAFDRGQMGLAACRTASDDGEATEGGGACSEWERRGAGFLHKACKD